VKKQVDVIEARNKLIEKYRNGKFITKVLMGVNSAEVSWKVFGEHTYWMKYRNKNYRELIEVVKALIEEYARRDGDL